MAKCCSSCDVRLYAFHNLCNRNFAKAEGAYHSPDTRPDMSTLMTVMMAWLRCRLTTHCSDLYLLQPRPTNV